MTKASFIFDGFSNAHKIVYIYYISEILADKVSKTKKTIVKCTLRKNPLKSHKLYFYTY